MCYSNCPGENWEGCCVRPSIQGTPQAHCWDGPKEEEMRKMGKGIKFRCIFCGKEHDTVEECNACEESH